MPARITDSDWVSPARYQIDERGCWVWLGGKCDDGYGKCGRRAGQTLAHRAFYVILTGPIPSGSEIDHLCKNRLCVNPDHLEAVPHAVNISRGDYKSNHRNGRKTHCKRGHEFTPGNTIIEARLSPKPRRKCRTCVNAGQRRRWSA